MLSPVKRTVILLSSLSTAAMATPALADVAPAPPLPALPGSTAPAAGGAQTPATTLAGAFPSAQQLYEHVRHGVVAIERNGIPVAIGTVLGGDGRILTALSGLGGVEGADVRYADGTLVHTKVGHSDKGSDLALLVPQSGKWTDGLTASEVDPKSADVRAMLPFHGGRLVPTEATFKGLTEAHTREGDALGRMFDLGLKAPPIAGAPLLDSTGSVVAVLVRACKGAAPEASPADGSPWAAWAGQATQAVLKAPCIPVVVGAPVSAIRSFLGKTPTTAVAPAPFLGVRGEAQVSGVAHGVRVTAVAPSSPAEKSGLKPSTDVIVAVDGTPVDSPEKLSENIGKHAVGDTVKLLVLGDDKFRDVSVVLHTIPTAPAAPVAAAAPALPAQNQ
jgi:serine protease Do